MVKFSLRYKYEDNSTNKRNGNKVVIEKGNMDVISMRGRN